KQKKSYCLISSAPCMLNGSRSLKKKRIFLSFRAGKTSFLSSTEHGLISSHRLPAETKYSTSLSQVYAISVFRARVSNGEFQSQEILSMSCTSGLTHSPTTAAPLARRMDRLHVFG